MKNLLLNLNNMSDADGIPYQHFIFKSGENHFKLQYLASEVKAGVDILLNFSNDGFLIKLAMAVDAIRRNKIGNGVINLLIPYFPGSRQDRVCNTGEAFSLKVYADFINNLNFNKVVIFDPHSDVTPALLNNVVVVKNYDFVHNAMADIRRILISEGNYILNPAHYQEKCGDAFWISPDAGANKKIFDLAKTFSNSFQNMGVIRADKIRDVSNGNIIDTEVFCDIQPENNVAVIVDDIISGGRTFLELAKKLKQKNFKKVFLIVSHHEGHANPTAIKESGIDMVYTTNSITYVTDAVTKQFDIKNYIIPNLYA